MKKQYRLNGVVWMLIITLLLTIVAPIGVVWGNGTTIKISTVEDFETFAKNSALDQWSVGKIVELMNDLDISESEVKTIPTFGGIFYGNRHTISGVTIEYAGTTQGLFRYIQQEGIVKNLIVEGSIQPTGSKATIGGVVGSNAGTIEQVSFVGTVAGTTNVGGIAGINLETGKIISSTVEGNISGEKMTGGIVGKNLGHISHSVNKASINTVNIEQESSATTDSMSVESLTETVEEISEEVQGNTDTGGIAGYSTGIIQDCENNGAVGYPHVGYNVGGIVGRQAGYLLGSKNSGVIYGRKDVGGIVGQMEPNVSKQLTEDVLTELQTELDVLRRLINGTVDEVESSSNQVSGHLSNLMTYSNDAKNSTSNLLDQTTEFVDGSLEQVNTIVATVGNTLKNVEAIVGDIEQAAKSMGNALKKMEAAIETMVEAGEPGYEAMESIQESIASIIKVNDNLVASAEMMKEAVTTLKKAVSAEDEATMKKALRQLSAAMNQYASDTRAIITHIEAIQQYIETIDTMPEFVEILPKIKEESKALKKALEKSANSFDTLASAVNQVVDAVSMDWETVAKALGLVTDALEEARKASGNMKESLEHLSTALEYIQEVEGIFGEGMKEVAEAMNLLAESSNSVGAALNKTKKLISELAGQKPVEFPQLGEEFQESSEALYASLGDISSELSSLNSAMNSSSKSLANQLRAINNQFYKVMELVLVMAQEMTSVGELLDWTNYIEDASEEDINNTTLGKVIDCENIGRVEADHNVGGIVGFIAIDYELDPEDDLEKPSGMNVIYQTKAVLQNCINKGVVIGKKDYVGGIVGRMRLGTTIGCENYGPVESTSGNYVGGVVGGATSSVRSSVSKAKVTGKNYVGGLAGSATNVKQSYTIPELVSTGEYVGALIGDAGNSREQLKDNYFIHGTIAGIDGISYAGKAEPIAYEELVKKVENISRFVSFDIRYMVEEEVLLTLPVEYGRILSGIEMPEIPEKEGYYSYWSTIESDTMEGDLVIEAIYEPWVSVLASEQIAQDSKLSIGLIEGQFTKEAIVMVEELSESELVEVPIEQKDNQWFKVWNVTTQHTALTPETKSILRLYNEEQKAVSIWQLQGEKWTEVSFEKQGKYSKLEMTGVDGTFCIQYQETTFNWNIIMLSIVGGILVCSGMIVLKKVTKKRKKVKEVQEENDSNI